jgi:hypothetical protein
MFPFVSRLVSQMKHRAARLLDRVVECLIAFTFSQQEAVLARMFVQENTAKDLQFRKKKY